MSILIYLYENGQQFDCLKYRLNMIAVRAFHKNIAHINLMTLMKKCLWLPDVSHLLTYPRLICGLQVIVNIELVFLEYKTTE